MDLITEGVNKHIEHVEDLIFDHGFEGLRSSIGYISSLRDMLAGNSKANVAVTVKFDGCIHEDTLVLTNYGDMSIKQIIELYQTDNNLMVMGKELQEDCLQYDHMVPVLGANVEDGNKLWVEIELEDGGKVKLTEDHEVHTSNRGWVKAGELNEDDDITTL